MVTSSPASPSPSPDNTSFESTTTAKNSVANTHDVPTFSDPSLDGDNSQLVVVANRLSTDMSVEEDGSVTWKRSPGGLVTALEPILRRRQGLWIGWPGIANEFPEPFTNDGIDLVPVGLTGAEVEAYYEGFSNGTLWPLYHDVIVPPEFHRAWWAGYASVNNKFATAVAETAEQGATVWVQDYQLQLVPKMLRTMRPDLKIGFFLHIPFPPAELFRQLPWRDKIIDGLLGADLVGFHIPSDARNFLEIARLRRRHPIRHDGRGIRRPLGTVTVDDRTVSVGVFPISVDSGALNRTAHSVAISDGGCKARHALGDPETLLLGVDRLDYTKGIDIRLQAFYELLQDGLIDPETTSFVQLATPSRERVDQYRIVRERVEGLVSRINGEFSSISRPLVSYVHRSVSRQHLLELYHTADVMIVTPLRDGMNLVAKEYLAAHPSRSGALVLSEFAGAAFELKHAYLCNPHDMEDVKASIMAAITDPADKRESRMMKLRRQVLTHDVDLWAQSFLDVLQGK